MLWFAILVLPRGKELERGRHKGDTMQRTRNEKPTDCLISFSLVYTVGACCAIRVFGGAALSPPRPRLKRIEEAELAVGRFPNAPELVLGLALGEGRDIFALEAGETFEKRSYRGAEPELGAEMGMGAEMTTPPAARGASEEDFFRRNILLLLRICQVLENGAAAAGEIL